MSLSAAHKQILEEENLHVESANRVLAKARAIGEVV